MPAAAPAPRPARPRCTRCLCPVARCLCPWIRPTACLHPVLVLQHPLEQHQAKGTARLLQLSLQPCQLEVGECFDPQQLAGWLGDPARCLLLYPATAGAQLHSDLPAAPTSAPAPVAAGAPAGDSGRCRLVLLDGTWRKTRKLLQCNPLLQSLPRLALRDPPPSRYAIRRAQAPWQRSTLEAACTALAGLENNPARYAPLLQAFEGWVQASVQTSVPTRARLRSG